MGRKYVKRHGAAAAGSSPRRAAASRYTPEQREVLESGLRILARLIVHAYLRDQAAQTSVKADDSART